MKSFATVLALCLCLCLSTDALAQPDPNYGLSLGSAVGVHGDSVEIPIHMRLPPGSEIWAFSFGVCASPGDGSLVDTACVGNPPPNDCVEEGIIVPGIDLAATNGGAGPDLFTPNTEIIPSDGWTLGTLVDAMLSGTLAAPEEAEVAVARYDLVGPPGGVSELSFCEIGDPVIFIEFALVGAVSVTPETGRGTITIIAPPVPYVRGDINGDSIVNGLFDALFLLNAFFTPGAPSIPCRESAEASGNGVLNPLEDGIFLLICHYVPGSPCPPAPFPACGFDPDPVTSLGCDEFPGCP